jgi:hypothetical protein
MIALSCGQTEPVCHPKERHDATDDEAMHLHRQKIASAHQPAIKQGQARQRHEQDQR